MTDKELLELAAKAAGIEIVGTFGEMLEIRGIFSDGRTYIDEWNPLTDEGDALRLALKLKLDIQPSFCQVWVSQRECDVVVEEVYGNDPCAATNRCIVRAAAEIGKQKE
jgi:hypothetical protein